ncbi:lolT-1 [Rhizoctonia solani AG-1 IA]|uniref:LolT-1 n=1 Tax=Thanatephorus cucumeris (strain AG1-IA) TaxID=983506 RepID=L8WV37_THACA|nr:lolT-1 [Rhizoctonia solani AG-1 IA]
MQCLADISMATTAGHVGTSLSEHSGVESLRIHMNLNEGFREQGLSQQRTCRTARPKLSLLSSMVRTLMHPAVLKRVIGNDASHLQAAPAVLLVSPSDWTPTRTADAISYSSHLLDTIGVIISGLRPEDVACLDVFEGDEYNRVRVEAHPIVPLAAISSNLTQTLLSASSDLPIELPPALKVETYVWAVETSRLEPVIWEYDTFVKEKLWKWAGSGADDNEYYEEVDRRRDMNGVIVVPSGGEGTLKPDYTFGHNMLQHFMFEEGYINLNHGSYGSLPKPVFDKCVETSKRIEARPDSFHRREYLPELRDVRARLAKLLNCDADECVVTNNATHGVHTIINNFHWKKVTSTYGSVFNICEFVSDTPPNPEHITVDLAFPISHKAIVDKFRQKLQDIPRHDGQIIVAVIDALASNPGVHLPWEELTKVCKEEGIYSLIDGAHAIGQIPLDMSISDPDFFVSASDTSYLSRILRNRNIIRSSFPTPHAYSSLKSKKEPDMVSQFEWTGTIDFVPFLSAKHALEFREAVGGEKNINDYCHSLAVRGGARLAEMFKTRVMDTDENDGSFSSGAKEDFILNHRSATGRLQRICDIYTIVTGGRAAVHKYGMKNRISTMLAVPTWKYVKRSNLYWTGFQRLIAQQQKDPRAWM